MGLFAFSVIVSEAKKGEGIFKFDMKTTLKHREHPINLMIAQWTSVFFFSVRAVDQKLCAIMGKPIEIIGNNARNA